MIKIDKSTGRITDKPVIPIDCPAYNPGGCDFKIDPPKILVEPEVGKKYWFAFRSYYGASKALFNIWPADGGAIDKTLDAVTRDDALKWMPSYNPAENLILEHLIETDKTWEVRVKRDQKILWQKTVSGNPFWGGCQFDRIRELPEDNPLESPSARVVIRTITEISGENEYDIPSDTYKIWSYYEGVSGKIREVNIDRVRPGYSTVLRREYDRHRGNIILDDRYHLEELSDGKYSWTRDLRKYDPVFLDLIERRLFKYGKRDDGGEGFIEIE